MTELDVVRGWVDAVSASLEASRTRIDDLNVYPVPDGDTGTNLALTVRSIRESLAGSTAEDRQSIAREVTRAALMGARGNSGVIFSQIVRGAAEVLGEAERPDAHTLARAVRGASDAAYRAVRRPVEGTMLSVIRELAEEAESRRGTAANAGDLLLDLVRRGAEAVARTPEQLDILGEAGVVDAGGAGLLEIVRGLTAAATGAPFPEAPATFAAASADAIHQELSVYRYCTVFLVEGDGLDQDDLESRLERLGDSLLVVGDRSALKVHVHTDDPGAALSLGTGAGTIDRVEIANMHEQTLQREERLLEALPDPTVSTASGVVAVVAGEGNRRLFESLGAARIVEGGRTMNPSAADLVAAVEAVEADEVLLLPNDSNVILAAVQAAELSSRRVEVVQADSIPGGLAAMVSFDPERSAAENAAGMRQTLGAVATGGVTVASRDVDLNGIAIRTGAWLGLAEGVPVAGGESFDEVAGAVIERLLTGPREVLTLLTGADEPQLGRLLERVHASHPGVELDVQPGGQPHYPLLLSAE
ncbi:MAG: DAK2 domain-containing protein [Gaiellaceae bacterium]